MPMTTRYRGPVEKRRTNPSYARRSRITACARNPRRAASCARCQARAVSPADVFAVVLASAAAFQYHAAGLRCKPSVPPDIPLEAAILAATGPCCRNTASRSIAESLDSTRLCALSSTTMARPRPGPATGEERGPSPSTLYQTSRPVKFPGSEFCAATRLIL